ncbi:tripartite tricarboxylate transporter TctB family protein [Actinobaculum suis]|uniref:tripartite tricarboxylate transporter TctB family protein n=1 Tax=Actinobaculum suis TaxID=1657 RepID=UPI0008087676|nr:tripartite tricarboxylate transporter TctB family protein [Actinobaculum suis]OCA93583.1 hypothetical protein ACU20_08770 [Actinobaculum suis]OCA93699.1 hypothetical protein ACU21_09155 [Actinobaculum suis]
MERGKWVQNVETLQSVDLRTGRTRPRLLRIYKENRGQVVAHLVLLAIAIIVFVMSVQYGLLRESGLVGPGLVPGLASVIMIFAIVWDNLKLVNSSRTQMQENAAIGVETAEEKDASGVGTQSIRVWAVFGVLLLTLVMTRIIGLLLSLALMVFVLVTFVERKSWWRGLIAALGVFAMGFIVFVVLLEVPLPTGLLGIV